MPELTGAQIIARALKQQGCETMFGIVGFPVFGLAAAAQAEGIRYYGFRNEQAASYAAGAVGYLTGRPGVCLSVSGPGMVHAIAGLSNAWANNWPMLLLGGANDSYQNGSGAFQECPQIEAARPFTKYAARPDSVRRLPEFVEQAVRTSMYGRPGASYLDLPNDLLVGKAPVGEAEDGEGASAGVRWPPQCPPPPRPLADPAQVALACDALEGAERPLVIVGKGAAYACAHQEVRRFLERTGLPFLATPMGKGVVPDDHPQSVAAARSFALREADVVLLVGARLNWMLHFGRAPRWAEGVKVLQVDLCAEEIGSNVPCAAAMVGDARQVARQLDEEMAARGWRHAGVEVPEETGSGEQPAVAGSPWWTALRRQVEENERAVEAMLQDDSEPMGYFRALRELRDLLPRDAIVVSEGANTMDISRTVLPNFVPRSRLDAGTFGTMGVGLGLAIAAAVTHPERKVVAVEGDSAFGFSGMEIEVACRYKLPITVVILNNNGITSGLEDTDTEPVLPWVYTARARYELLAEAFGGLGLYVERLADLRPALERALASDRPAIVNVIIDPKARRKPQKHDWLTR
ncbi:MAG: oxalyl-CoA decarboxylase [Acidobacteria bacterium]|nr:MAG: oxalyl-CoA decarboxylase [Acidobacteriota bacterium]REK03858.1 MAG: oxalyl-CoA decarboxylase [Acidobacteriota bacterium]